MDDLAHLGLRPHAEGTILPVKVVPGASRDRIAGVLGDALKVQTSAPPEKGKANAAVAAALAKALSLDRKSVELLSGPASPRKEFLLRGVTPEEVRTRLARA